MERNELPEYKQIFLSEMDELRRQEEMQNTVIPVEQKKQNSKPSVVENNVMNTSMYSSPDWRQTLTQTTTQGEFNEDRFKLNFMLNPEVKKKSNNIQLTQISAYSNAKHNNTVFVNPKNTSC